MPFENYLFSFCKNTIFYARFWRITPKYSLKPREKSHTSELVLKLKRFEVGAYAVLNRLTAGIMGFLGGGVHQI